MMKFKSKAEKRELDMTSMIDITFLLIAFFMVLINFSEADQNERIALPSSELVKPPDVPPTEPITLQVLEDGRVIYDGSENDVNDLKKKLELYIKVLKSINVDPKTATVIIRAHKDCPTGRVQDVIETCQLLQLENFKLRAKQSAEQ